MIGRPAIGLLFCAFQAAYEMRPQMHISLVAFSGHLVGCGHG